jgi:hypothetical protein
LTLLGLLAIFSQTVKILEKSKLQARQLAGKIFCHYSVFLVPQVCDNLRLDNPCYGSEEGERAKPGAGH